MSINPCPQAPHLLSLRDTNDDRQGWTSSPNSRGTMDILWSCLSTLFLCCWSVLVVNVPDPRSTRLQILFRKLILLGLCTLAPELVFQAALGQWVSAHRSTLLFHESGYRDWTVTHSFYADMGGIHLRLPDWKSFPINSRQLHYLITRNYTAYPRIEEDRIRDKNKVDGMLRFITLTQTLWFLVNLISRAAQKLPVTALELSTSAFVMMSIAITLCWMNKPADVESVDYITSEVPLATILVDAGDEAVRVYQNTPLDFASRHEWIWTAMWSHGLHCLRGLKLNVAALPLQRPIQRFENSVIFPIEGWYYLYFAIVTISYFTIFIVGWNFSFVTPIEHTLWRAASLTALVSVLGVYVSMQLFVSWLPTLHHKLLCSPSEKGPVADLQSPDAADKHTRDHYKQKGLLASLTALLTNNSLLKDPTLDAPPGLIVATWFFGILYCSSRAYIIIADFMELRSLPRRAYDSVNWSGFWPHV